jgi:hypothetical protein
MSEVLCVMLPLERQWKGALLLSILGALTEFDVGTATTLFST